MLYVRNYKGEIFVLDTDKEYSNKHLASCFGHIVDKADALWKLMDECLVEEHGKVQKLKLVPAIVDSRTKIDFTWYCNTINENGWIQSIGDYIKQGARIYGAIWISDNQGEPVLKSVTQMLPDENEEYKLTLISKNQVLNYQF